MGGWTPINDQLTSTEKTKLLWSYVGGIVTAVGWGLLAKYMDAHAFPSTIVVLLDVDHLAAVFGHAHSLDPFVAISNTAGWSYTFPVLHPERKNRVYMVHRHKCIS